MIPIFFFNDTATTEIYTLSLHDALPISDDFDILSSGPSCWRQCPDDHHRPDPDRKSTRLNSSHSQISYAVFCLKKNNIVYTINLGSQLKCRHTQVLLDMDKLSSGSYIIV